MVTFLSISSSVWAQCNCTVQDIIDDLNEPHEGGTFVGVPEDYSWSSSPNTKDLNDLLTPVHTRITAWGQVYIANAEQPVLNARVAIKDISLWILKEGKWQVVQNSGAINGAYFVSDFGVNGDGGLSNPSANKQYPSDAGISVRPIVTNNFHFWPETRGTIEPSAIEAILVAASFKLVRDEDIDQTDLDNNGVDDLQQAKFQANIGADLWLPDKGWKWIPDKDTCLFEGYPIAKRQNGCAGNIGMGQGTARFVTTEWTARFAMYAMGNTHLSILNNYPPPIEGFDCGNRKANN
jgi:hypothetical protein